MMMNPRFTRLSLTVVLALLAFAVGVSAVSADGESK
jgi:hypothetical protein